MELTSVMECFITDPAMALCCSAHTESTATVHLPAAVQVIHVCCCATSEPTQLCLIDEVRFMITTRMNVTSEGEKPLPGTGKPSRTAPRPSRNSLTIFIAQAR